MKITNYPRKEHDEKHKYSYFMTIADLRIEICRLMLDSAMSGSKIRIVDVKTGEVEQYENMNHFIKAELDNQYEIELFDVHTVYMTATCEEIIVACFRDKEDNT